MLFCTQICLPLPSSLQSTSQILQPRLGLPPIAALKSLMVTQSHAPWVRDIQSILRYLSPMRRSGWKMSIPCSKKKKFNFLLINWELFNWSPQIFCFPSFYIKNKKREPLKFCAESRHFLWRFLFKIKKTIFHQNQFWLKTLNQPGPWVHKIWIQEPLWAQQRLQTAGLYWGNKHGGEDMEKVKHEGWMDNGEW